jgi:hypothetical protein
MASSSWQPPDPLLPFTSAHGNLVTDPCTGHSRVLLPLVEQARLIVHHLHDKQAKNISHPATAQ